MSRENEGVSSQFMRMHLHLGVQALLVCEVHAEHLNDIAIQSATVVPYACGRTSEHLTHRVQRCRSRRGRDWQVTFGEGARHGRARAQRRLRSELIVVTRRPGVR